MAPTASNSPAPPNGPNPNTWSPPANPYAAPGGWNSDPNSPSNPIAQLTELMQRQNAQTQLSEQQKQALAELSAIHHQQKQQLEAVANRDRQSEAQRIAQQADLLRRQQEELEGVAELRRRALELDANNKDLHSQLAQTEQQNRLYQDQMTLLQQQLQDTASQLQGAMSRQSELNNQLMATQSESEQRYQMAQMQAQERIQMAQSAAQQRIAALESSMQRRGGATIRANSSAIQKLEAISIAGLEVRQDGDVIRIEIPSDQIFMPATATLNTNALPLLDRVASAIRQNYPRQVVGIEAHTDNSPMQTGTWRSGHQLSAAQAMAVFEQLTQRHQFGEKQLFVLGHGPNYPVASNGTPAGQQRNRRLEVVIYPETVGSR